VSRIVESFHGCCRNATDSLALLFWQKTHPLRGQLLRPRADMLWWIFTWNSKLGLWRPSPSDVSWLTREVA
jgi:hypothetical protein